MLRLHCTVPTHVCVGIPDVRVCVGTVGLARMVVGGGWWVVGGGGGWGGVLRLQGWGRGAEGLGNETGYGQFPWEFQFCSTFR